MALIRKKSRLLGPGSSAVYHRRTTRIAPPSSFRLDTPEDVPRPERGRSLYGWRRRRLAHYISAGGTEQTKRTWADDVREMRQRIFLIVLSVFLAVWVIFYFLPHSILEGGL